LAPNEWCYFQLQVTDATALSIQISFAQQLDDSTTTLRKRRSPNVPQLLVVGDDCDDTQRKRDSPPLTINPAPTPAPPTPQPVLPFAFVFLRSGSILPTALTYDANAPLTGCVEERD
jgi:hypothetical protein